MFNRIRLLLFGAPRDLNDPQLYHRVSLVAFLAWIGLGADGLSSSCYGPDEAFRALGAHPYLAIIIAAMTATTVFVIAVAYSSVIEHFPGGGGGYLVATKLLGEKAGVVSGCALIVDYVLTITVSVASGCDALWSFLPPQWAAYKFGAEVAVLLFLVILNLRGVKESVTFLAPIFLLFVVIHVLVILYAVGSHLTGLPVIFQGCGTGNDQHRRPFGKIQRMATSTVIRLARDKTIGGSGLVHQAFPHRRGNDQRVRPLKHGACLPHQKHRSLWQQAIENRQETLQFLIGIDQVIEYGVKCGLAHQRFTRSLRTILWPWPFPQADP